MSDIYWSKYSGDQIVRQIERAGHELNLRVIEHRQTAQRLDKEVTALRAELAGAKAATHEPVVWERSSPDEEPPVRTHRWVRTSDGERYKIASGPWGSMMGDGCGGLKVMRYAQDKVHTILMADIVAIGPTRESVTPKPEPKAEPSTWDRLLTFGGPDRFRLFGLVWRVDGVSTARVECSCEQGQGLAVFSRETINNHAEIVEVAP